MADEVEVYVIADPAMRIGFPWRDPEEPWDVRGTTIRIPYFLGCTKVAVAVVHVLDHGKESVRPGAERTLISMLLEKVPPHQQVLWGEVHEVPGVRNGTTRFVRMAAF